jgi:polynucleotide 5'-kinase involved in rRNA processing
MYRAKSKQKARLEQAKKLTKQQASSNQAEIGRVNSEQERRLQLIEDILKKLERSQEVNFDIGAAFILT